MSGVASDLLNIECGVPQGSVLGPMLFLLYVNDMSLCSNILKFFLFADDTTILCSSDKLDNLYDIMNAELIHLTDWFATNKLSLNITKTNYILFKNHKGDKDTQNIQTLLLNNNKVVQVQTTKFLGVEVDHKLNWSHHIKRVENKLSSNIYILRKVRHKINKQTAFLLYDTLILPHLSYCNLVWGNTFKKYLLNILRLQKRALRVCILEKNLKSANLFSLCNRLPFELIARYQSLQIVHQFFYDYNTLPITISSLLTKTSNVHQYATRAADNLCLFIHPSKLEIRKKAFKVCVPEQWNELPLDLRYTNSFLLFKRNLKHHFLSAS